MNMGLTAAQLGASCLCYQVSVPAHTMAPSRCFPGLAQYVPVHRSSLASQGSLPDCQLTWEGDEEEAAVVAGGGWISLGFHCLLLSSSSWGIELEVGLAGHRLACPTWRPSQRS